jgi:hypothetical protein
VRVITDRIGQTFVDCSFNDSKDPLVLDKDANAVIVAGSRFTNGERIVNKSASKNIVITDDRFVERPAQDMPFRTCEHGLSKHFKH